MDILILCFIIAIIILLNIAAFFLHKKGKLNLILSGVALMILAPVLGFLSGALFYQFYDWSSGGTGEGAGIGGAVIGIVTLLNGALIFGLGIIGKILKMIKTKNPPV
ncbi:inner-membrane translocator [Cytobacillus sp. FJAT-54145]|uniref:Inner-membrane translocator n=1 Tax=Cytobacillus spartinae TaxID=3299023 RepID=A0ABW6KBE5_9BACI